MPEATIEPAETDDVEALVDLWVALARSQRSHGSHVLPADNRTAVRETVARHVVGDGLLVARADGIVGFVMFSVESGTVQQSLARGVVENLYVVPERRAEGIGAALLAAAEAALRHRDVEAVSLEVMAENERARRFYRRQGYQPHRVELEKSLESDTPSKGDP